MLTMQSMLPQFIALYKDPEGKKVFRKSENRTATDIVTTTTELKTTQEIPK